MLDWPESCVTWYRFVFFFKRTLTRIRYSSSIREFEKSVRTIVIFARSKGKLRRGGLCSILNEQTKKSVQPRTSSWERSFHSRVQTWSERKLVWKCDIPDSSRKLIESMTRGNIIVIQYYRFRRLSCTTRISGSGLPLSIIWFICPDIFFFFPTLRTLPFISYVHREWKRYREVIN